MMPLEDTELKRTEDEPWIRGEGRTKRSEGLKKQRLTLHSQPSGLEGVHTCVLRVKYLSKTGSQRNTVNQ